MDTDASNRPLPPLQAHSVHPMAALSLRLALAVAAALLSLLAGSASAQSTFPCYTDLRVDPSTPALTSTVIKSAPAVPMTWPLAGGPQVMDFRLAPWGGEGGGEERKPPTCATALSPPPAPHRQVGVG